jgi:hypothetical protein
VVDSDQLPLLIKGHVRVELVPAVARAIANTTLARLYVHEVGYENDAVCARDAAEGPQLVGRVVFGPVAGVHCEESERV